MNRLTEELIAYEKSGSFWTLARNDAIMRILKIQRCTVVTDMGCGSGIFTKTLLQQGHTVISADYEKDAVAYTKKINPKTYQVDLTKKITLKQQADIYILGDVIEHIHDDHLAIKNLSAFMKEGAIVFISVPALQFFWTKNDAVRDHFRRYSKKSLRSLLEDHGFEIKEMCYWNFIGIFPVLYQKFGKKYINYVEMSKSRINTVLLNYFLKFENRIRVPIGLSLFCIAVKKTQVKKA